MPDHQSGLAEHDMSRGRAEFKLSLGVLSERAEFYDDFITFKVSWNHFLTTLATTSDRG